MCEWALNFQTSGVNNPKSLKITITGNAQNAVWFRLVLCLRWVGKEGWGDTGRNGSWGAGETIVCSAVGVP